MRSLGPIAVKQTAITAKNTTSVGRVRPAQKGWQGAMEQRADSPHEKAFVSRGAVGTTSKGPYGRGGMSKEWAVVASAAEGVVFPAMVAQQNRMVTLSLNLNRWQIPPKCLATAHHPLDNTPRYRLLGRESRIADTPQHVIQCFPWIKSNQDYRHSPDDCASRSNLPHCCHMPVTPGPKAL